MLRRAPVVASTFLLGLLATYVLLSPPQQAGAAYLDLCPMEIAGLRGIDLETSQTVLDDLNPDGLLSRSYELPDGRPIWLTIVYFENARLGAHDPLLCYRSQGFDVEVLDLEQLPSAIGTIPLNTFSAKRGERNERVNYFWYTSGGQTLAEVKTFRDRMFLQGLRENRSFGAFVRISTIEEENPAETQEVLHRFTEELAPLLPNFFPENAG